MNTFLFYLLEASFILTVLFVLYWLLLRKETFYQWNRVLLMANFLLAISLPLLPLPNSLQDVKTSWLAPSTIEKTVVDHASPAAEQSYDLTAFKDQKPAPAEKIEVYFSVPKVLFLVYTAGALFFLLRFLIQLFSLFRILLFAERRKEKNHILAIVGQPINAFSFLNYLVINRKQLENEAVAKSIITHEMVHIREWHSMDIFLAELYCIVFWFNPFAWLNNNFLRLNLEFIADQKSIQQLHNAKSYQYDLLHMTFVKQQFRLTNHFIQSTLKNRIAMINKMSSPNLAKAKYLSFLPVILALIMGFSKPSKKIYEVIPSDQLNNIYLVVAQKTSQSKLEEMKEELKKYDIVFTWDNMKYNENGKLESLKMYIELPSGSKCSSGATSNLKFLSASIFASGKGTFGCSAGLRQNIPSKIALELIDEGGVAIRSAKQKIREDETSFNLLNEKIGAAYVKKENPCEIPYFLQIDDQNKFFEIPCINSYPYNKITLKDRWGDVVYEASPYKNDWEGDVENGAYSFVFKTTDNEKIDHAQGSIVVNKGKCAVPAIINVERSRTSVLTLPCAAERSADELIIENDLREVIYKSMPYKNDWALEKGTVYRYKYRMDKESPYSTGVIIIE